MWRHGELRLGGGRRAGPIWREPRVPSGQVHQRLLAPKTSPRRGVECVLVRGKEWTPATSDGALGNGQPRKALPAP